MTNVITPMNGPGVGIGPANGTYLVRNVTASTMAIGSLVMLDLALADGDTTSVLPFHTTSSACDTVFGNVILASTPLHQRQGQYFILLEAITAGSTGKAAAAGAVTGNVRYGAGDIAKGQALVADTVSGLLVPAQTWSSHSATSSQGGFLHGEKIVGFALITASIASTDTTSLTTGISVWFNGLGAGFGNNAF